MQNVKLGTLISVFFFGMIGGMLRYLLGLKLASTGTILVNLIGSFCLAFLTYYVIERQKLPAWLSTGLGTGMVGAFTTFSTFTVDILGLSTFTDATFYLLISVVGGFLLAYTGMILGRAFADFIAFSSPEAIILFGGLAKSGDYIMEPIKKALDENVLPIFKGKTKLLMSQLKDADAAVLGASALGWEAKALD